MTAAVLSVRATSFEHSIWLCSDVDGAVVATWAEMVIEGLQDCLAALITIVHLDLLVLVSDQLLHIDTALTGHSQHDATLCRDLGGGELGLLDLKVSSLLGLLRTHFILRCDSCLKLIQICAGGYWELKDISLEEGA